MQFGKILYFEYRQIKLVDECIKKFGFKHLNFNK